MFGLRGRDEHRELTVGQFVIGQDENGKYVEFFGKASKNMKGGLQVRKLDCKKVRHYSSRNDERCLVTMYDLYLKAVTPNGSGADMPFYWKPLSGTGLRYDKQVIGCKTIGLIIKCMCEAAKLDGNFTSHSGKRTCANLLYQAGVPEEMIMARAGHGSVDGEIGRASCRERV